MESELRNQLVPCVETLIPLQQTSPAAEVRTLRQMAVVECSA